MRRRSLRPNTTITFSDDENTDPQQTDNNKHIEFQGNTSTSMPQQCSRNNSPFTPLQNLVSNMRKKLEILSDVGGKTPDILPNKVEQQTESLAQQNVSPGLARLRNTPGRSLKSKQRVLEMKHRETKEKCSELSVGGGVCMWPDMDNMRLTQSETLWLVVTNLLLMPVTIWLFYCLHGDLVFELLEYTERLRGFQASHQLEVYTDTENFKTKVLRWHSDYRMLMESVHDQFDVSWLRTSTSYKLCVLLYVLGICVLLYFLADNVFANSKLSPRRIKLWVTLLTVIGLWTVLTLKLFVLAQRLEKWVENNIHEFSGYLADLVHTSQDLTTYQNVLLYWRTCCLPPTSQGTLTLMGVLSLQDLSYYLQYYSLPVLTALLTPILKLIVSLRQVYTPHTHKQ